MSRPGWPGTPDGWRSTYLPYHASWLIRSSFGSTACNAGACACLTSRQETTWRRRSWRLSTPTTASTPTPIDGRTPARRLPPDIGHELTPGSTGFAIDQVLNWEAHVDSMQRTFETLDQ